MFAFLENSDNSLTTLAAINAQLDLMAKRVPDILELASSFDITYEAARTMTMTLGLSNKSIREASFLMQQLRRAGADTATSFTILSKKLGLTAEQIDELETALDGVQEQTDGIAELQGALSNLFILDKLLAFKSEMSSIGAIFSDLQTQLQTTLGGSAAADAAFGRIQEFAATTPFQLTEVTQAFVKLKGRGIDPTNDALRQLGDLASSQSKSLDQLTEAVLDASQGEFERLKEFGIRASAAGDQVSISFQNTTTQVEKSADAITAGILALGDYEGVAGGMAASSASLGGEISNLQDNTERFTAEAQALVAGPMAEFIGAANSILGTFFELNPNIQKLILGTVVLGTTFASAVVTLSAFKAAMIGESAATVFNTAVKLPNTVATKLSTLAKQADMAVDILRTPITAANTKATIVSTGVTKLSTKATIAKTKAVLAQYAALGLLAGVALAAVGAIASVVGVYAAMNRSANESRKAIDGVTQALEAYDEAVDKREAATAKAIATERALNKATIESNQTMAERSKALEERDITIQEEFNESIQESIGWFGRLFDVMLNTLTLGGQLKLLSEIDIIPEGLRDALSGLADNMGRLGTIAEGSGNRAKVAFADTLVSADALSAAFAQLNNTPIDDLSINEVERLEEAYNAQIEALEAQVPANAEAAAAQEIYIRALEDEKEVLLETKSALEDRRSRVLALGTAQEQYAAQYEAAADKVRRSVATDADAQSLLDATQKQLDAGFITTETAIAQFEEVAQYRAASADTQIGAINGILSAQTIASDRTLELYETERAQLELLAASQIESEEAVQVKLEQLAEREIQTEIDKQNRLLNIELTNGRVGSQAAIDAKNRLDQLEEEQQAQSIRTRQAKETELLSELESANEDATNAISEARAKASQEAAAAELAAIKSGSTDVEAVRAQAVQRELSDRAAATDQLITLKQQEIAAVKQAVNEGVITEKDGLDQQLALRTELAELQSEGLDTEIEAVKAAEDEKLRVIQDAVNEQARIRGIANDTDNANDIQAQVNAIRDGNQSIEEAERELATARRNRSAAEAQFNLDILQQEQAAIEQAVEEGTISRETAADRIKELESERATLVAETAELELESIRAAQEEAIRIYSKAAEKRREAIEDTGILANEAELEAELAAIQDFTVSAEDLSDQLLDLRVKNAEATRAASAAALQAELRDINQAFSDKVLDEETYESEVRRVTNEIAAVRADALQAEIDDVRRLRGERSKAIEDYKDTFTSAADLIQQSLDGVNQELTLQNNLLSAQESLQAALNKGQALTIDFAIEELEYQKGIAEAAGNKGRAAKFEEDIQNRKLELLAIEREQLLAQFEAKMLSLEITQEQTRLQLEQNRLTQELAVLQAQADLAAAEANGLSDREIDNLTAQLALKEAGLKLSDRALENQDKINKLVQDEAKQTLRNNLRVNSNEQRKINRAAGRSSTDESKRIREARAGTPDNVVDLDGIREQVSTATATAEETLANGSVLMEASQRQFVETIQATAGGLESFVSITQAIEELDTEALIRNVAALGGGDGPLRRRSGGRIEPGNQSWVGEAGPELMFFDQGGYVANATTSAKAIRDTIAAAKAPPAATAVAGNSVSNSVTEQLAVTFGSPDEPQFENWLRLQRTMNRLKARR